MNEDILAKLQDIKAIEKIPDNSIFLFSILVFLAIILLLIIIFIIIKLLKKKKISDRKKYYKILQTVDFVDSKKAAYAITKYSRLIALNEREKRLSDELIEELEKFKYKKNVEHLNDVIKIKYSIFMDSLDV
jgi:flagellar biosynthesis/type III secretory pathway M-ring protein FliF/YscJ